MVVPEPGLNLQLGCLGLAGTSAYFDNYVLAGILGVLGVFLLIQSTRVKFLFKKSSLVGESFWNLMNTEVVGFAALSKVPLCEYCITFIWFSCGNIKHISCYSGLM